MDYIISALGLIGAFCCLLMYLWIEQEKIDGKSRRYYIINGVGGFLIFVSVLYKYDPGDLGSLAVEGAWILISLMGILKTLRLKK